MQTLQSFLSAEWHGGTGEPQILVNPATEEPIAQASAEGLDLAAALAFARERGGAALRALTFGERGELCAAFARAIHQHRDELIELAIKNGGNTRSDAKFDVDGASGTLAHYAELAAAHRDARLLVDGEHVPVGRSARLAGRHLWTTRRGVALHINAFNFPAWGLCEKAACAIVAGMPVVSKPATSTALVAHRLVEIAAPLLPPGALSLVVGSAHGLPDLLGDQDVIAFTGSSATAEHLRGLAGVRRSAVRLNIEADSLNVAVLGPDVEAGSETFELFVRDVAREMTQKAGQKCTAVRRVFVPEPLAERVREDLRARLCDVVVGDPAQEGVHMGPLATAQQLRDVRAGIAELRSSGARTLCEGEAAPRGVPAGKGYFVPPTLLESDAAAAAVHELEVFGPVATLIVAPESAAAVGAAVARGGGGLVASLYSDDRRYCAALVSELAPWHGRICIGSRKIAEQALSPGTVLPGLIHGGPGRAGGGEELGGARGLCLYMQRTAVQGDRALLDALTDAQAR